MPSVDEPGRAGPSRPGRTVGTVQQPLRVSRHPCVEWVLERVLHGTRSPWPLSIEPTRAAAEAARTLWHSARRTRLRHCSRDPTGKCRHSAEIEPPRMLGAGGEGVGNAPSSVKGRGLRTNGYPWWVAATDSAWRCLKPWALSTEGTSVTDHEGHCRGRPALPAQCATYLERLSEYSAMEPCRGHSELSLFTVWAGHTCGSEGSLPGCSAALDSGSRGSQSPQIGGSAALTASLPPWGRSVMPASGGVGPARGPRASAIMIP